MLRKFRIRLNGQEYVVEMEELTEGSDFTTPATQSAPTQSQQSSSQGNVAEPLTTSESAVEESTPHPTESASTTPGAGETASAPMPGTILKVFKNEGDSVDESEPVLVLEAMKMENRIVSPKSGRITSILVKEGQTVDVSDVLFTVD